MKSKPEDTDLLQKQESYEDKGARRDQWSRLSYAPAGRLKILMIEHIDRATIGSAIIIEITKKNLSQIEIIIASTTNKDSILPTILSHLLLIHCDALYTPAVLDEDGKKLLSDIVWALETKDIAILEVNDRPDCKKVHLRGNL